MKNSHKFIISLVAGAFLGITSAHLKKAFGISADSVWSGVIGGGILGGGIVLILFGINLYSHRQQKGNDKKMNIESAYNLEMSERLLESATLLLEKNGDTDYSTCQAVIYLSLVSIEISLKATLEKAGFKEPQLRKISHNIPSLFTAISFCESMNGNGQWRRMSRIRSYEIEYKSSKDTVGSLVERMPDETSKFPNDIRYTNQFKHFPAPCVHELARAIVHFCAEGIKCELRLTASTNEIIEKISKK